VKQLKVIGLLLILIFVLAQCRKSSVKPPAQQQQLDTAALSAGLATITDSSAQAFENGFSNLTGNNLHVHHLGDVTFNQAFVAPPAALYSGLGTIFNNTSCINCHQNNGMGFPTAGAAQSALLLRISLPGTDAHGGPVPVPGYGLQIQDKAVPGKQPEAKVNITYRLDPYTFFDGEPYQLRQSSYTITNLYTPISGSYALSPRLAPPMIGLGLLEAVPESEILALADPNDANGDGIKGRANYVWDPATNSMQLGRFGWKANTASILTQVAAAFNQDMGITNSVFPVENSFGQPQYDGLSDDPELPDSLLTAVKFYAQTLGVPARRNTTDPTIKRGEQLFIQVKCASCHTQTLTTGFNAALPALSNQVIHPYTDMLLHDMGTDLQDHRQDYLAGSKDWRTPALWGIGLYAKINSPGVYLHDGRARTLTEAIMWHGGESAPSKNAFAALPMVDRHAILSFLGSL